MLKPLKIKQESPKPVDYGLRKSIQRAKRVGASDLNLIRFGTPSLCWITGGLNV